MVAVPTAVPATVWKQQAVKVESSLFGGKINFFANVAVRPWVPKVEFLTVLGQSFQIKKTATFHVGE